MAGRSPTKKRAGKAPSRRIETPKAERNAPMPPPVARRHMDLWAPVRLAGVLTAVAWPARWILDSRLGPDARPWLLLLFAAVWLILTAIFRRHITNGQERAAALGTLAAAGVWMQCVWWGAFSAWTLMWALLVGIVLAIGLQALNGREWARGRIRSEVEAWPELMRNTLWEDTFPVGEREVIAPGVTRRRIRRKDKAETSIKDLLQPKARERYEERHHLDDGTVRIERDGKSHTDVLITEVRKDPHAGKLGITWNAKPLRHIWDQLVVGYYEDGKPEVYVPWRKGNGPRHGLIAGMTGSGKSTLMRLLACAIAPAEEAVTIMVDCKGGQSFGRLAALFSWFQHDLDEALSTLEGVVALMHHRQNLARQRGWSGYWRASAADPVYFVFVDELAKLVGIQAPSNAFRTRAQSLLVQIVQEGRSTGFCFIGATQFPTVEAIGTSQFRSQIDWRVCFRMPEAGQDDVVLSNKPSSVDASRIDSERVGTCYVQNGDRLRTVPCRVINVPDGLDEDGEPDPDIEDVVTPILWDWWETKTPIPEEETVYLDEDGAWSRRTIYGPNGETHVMDPEDDDAPEIEEAGVTMTALDQEALSSWLNHELPGVPPHDCGRVPTSGDAVMGRCAGCGDPYPEAVASALRVLAMDATPQTPDHAPARPALRAVPDLPQEESTTMTAPAAAVSFADLVAAHEPTPEQRAADEAAAARMEQAYSNEDTPSAREAAWRLFLDAGAAGLAPVEVYRHPTVQRGDSWGYKLIAQWREQGHLKQVEAGRHRVADQYLQAAR